MENESIKGIKELLLELKCKCVKEGIPLCAIVQYHDGQITKTYAENVTPALVNFDTSSRVIYDCMSILNGGFICVPKDKSDETYD